MRNQTTISPEERGVLQRFPEFMKGSGLKYAGSVSAVAVSVLTGFVTPLLIAGAVDAITDTLNGAGGNPVNLPGFLAGWFDVRGGAEYLARHVWIVAALLVAVSLIGGLFQYLRGKWSAEASETIAERMRTRLYDHLLAMDYDYHVKAQTGDLIQRCTTDVETVRRFLASQVIEIFRTVIMVVLALSLMSSIHVPLMDATRGSFNAELFAKMKKGAALINLARGELVNNADLLAALESGQIRRYVTDFPADEVIGAPGVVAIPHLGASTPESEDNCVDMVSRQLEDYLKFGSIVNSVNYPACPLSGSFKYRLAVLHANVPNTLGPITSQVAAQGVNIDNMVNKSRGEFAYTVLDLDEPASQETIDRIAALDFIYRVRYFC